MKHAIDISQWKRREHFAFYKDFDEPFHSVTVHLDCTRAHQRARDNHQSFFLTYLHAILRAANATEALRYRLEDEQVVVYDTIHAGPTVGRADHTFGFCRVHYQEDFNDFAQRARADMDRVKAASGLCMHETAGQNDLLYMSVLPGIRFTSLTNAQMFGKSAGIPKITLGQCTETAGRMHMPMAVFAHHALVDGYDLEQFIARTEALLA
jgi:chloramphenicol O-acetyltransferase type A